MLKQCAPVAILFLCVAIGASMIQGSERQAADQWEYGMLTQLEGGICGWYSGDIGSDADSAHALHVTLGGQMARDDFTIEDLFNIFGAEGWELIAIETKHGGTMYHFKRRP